MQTNHSFSFQRFALLCKQSLIINKKLIGITLTGFVGTLFLALIFFQSISHFSEWRQEEYMRLFLFLFPLFGIIFCGMAFPAFRSKEKSMAFLMLPASDSEKYIFEFLIRVVLYILIMPFLFWNVVYLENSVVHSFIPSIVVMGNITSVGNLTFNGLSSGWVTYLIIQGGLFIFISAFTGASHFIKSPLLKTMFTLSVVVAGGALFTLLLVKGLNLREFHPVNHRVLFIKNEQEAMAAFSIGITLINLSLLAIAWFRLKEKEV